ncbi:MAG: hypothetical protein EOO20_21635 [Chryseobacterium sp.]|nr:MAG: hypothetical protein EOO20_21635 [Chryseobacterium sp.]
METQKGKSFYLVFVFALSFTVYYAYSSYRGSLRMAEYDIARAENESLITKLDSLLSKVDESKMTDKEINQLADERELAFQRRDIIENNKLTGSGIYRRRLIKFWAGLGLTVITFGVYQYLRRKRSA